MEHGDGAGGENRTPDPLISNQLLYQLSYAGIVASLPCKTAQGCKILRLGDRRFRDGGGCH